MLHGVSGETKTNPLIQAESLGVMLCCFFDKLFFLIFFLFPSLVFSPPPLPPRPVESDNTLRIKNEKTRSLLLFTNVTEKHFGNYTCFAANRLGASNASMLLFRKLSPTRSCRCMPTMTVYTYASPSFRKNMSMLAFIS